jgi:biotin carboxyl carrier protein
MRYYVTIDGCTHSVETGGDQVLVDGKPVRAELRVVPGTNVHHLLADGASYALVARSSPEEAGGWELDIDGERFTANVVDERTRAIRAMTGRSGAVAGPKPIRAPMPGLVLRITVAPADSVRAGQGVAIVEAMKMENELKAEAPGIVSRVLVSAGQAVEKGQVLIEFEADAAPVEGGP